MSLDGRLAAWLEAGLIDAGAAARIRAFEAGRERPTAIWAIAGLGLFALVLGIILIVSANWDRIGAPVKLAAHLALLAGAGGGAWVASRDGWTRLAEGLLFLFAGLVLAGIALHAQLYQLTGPAWHALLLWLALAGPALLVGGTSRLTGYALGLMALLGPAAMAIDTVEAGGAWRLAQGLAMTVPLLMLALAQPGWIAPGLRAALAEAGILASLAAASIAHFAWASNITPDQAVDNAVRFVPVAFGALLALALAGRGSALPAPLRLPILVGPPLAAALALALPHPDATASRLVGVVIFVAMWTAIARGAAASARNALFGIAIAAIGIRIFIIYLELFGSLASTGFGLVAGGALVVALSLAWHRIVRGRRA